MVEVSQESQDTQTGGELCPSQHDPGIILGWSKYPRNPKLLRERGDKFSLSQDDPATVEESQESQDTQPGGSCVHPRMILGWSKYPGNPKILRQGGELCPSRDDPGMVGVSRQSHDQREGELCPSLDDPGMILRWSKYPKKAMYRQVRGVFFIAGSSWDHTEDVLEVT